MIQKKYISQIAIEGVQLGGLFMAFLHLDGEDEAISFEADFDLSFRGLAYAGKGEAEHHASSGPRHKLPAAQDFSLHVL